MEIHFERTCRHFFAISPFFLTSFILNQIYLFLNRCFHMHVENYSTLNTQFGTKVSLVFLNLQVSIYKGLGFSLCQHLFLF